MATNVRTLIQSLYPFIMPQADLDELAVEAPLFLPIVPTARLWLPQLGIGDDERFATIFRDTWRVLPLRARRLLVRHWREGSSTFPIQGLWSPNVQLADDWALSDRSVRNPKDLAVCGRRGHSLYFFAPVVDAMPVRHVKELIAHELAHAVLYAIGEMRSTDRNQPRGWDDTEIMADEIMELWGFDSEAMDAWLREHWKWPDDKQGKRKSRK